jgi:Uma2 family endonuclease
MSSAGTLPAMGAVAARFTADEYLSREDPRRTELIDGIVIVHEPTIPHQRVCLEIIRALSDWVRGGGHGEATLPLDVRLDERTVLAPDVLWFADRLPEDAARAPRPPDLAVEVRSPSTWTYDVGRKRALYEHHGVRELWLVDTVTRKVLRYARTGAGAAFDVAEELGDGQVLTSKLLPGFRLPVAEIFPY